MRLPAAAVAAAARGGAATDVSGAGDVRDRERTRAAVALGLGDHVVAGAAARLGDGDLAGAGTDVEAGRAGGHLRRTAGVRLGVGEAGLHVGDQVARVGLRGRVLTLLTLAEEGRQSNGGKDADDQNDDQELDKGETLLVLSALAELVEHCGEPS